MLAELDRTGESQISLTDPESRAMAAHTHVAGLQRASSVDAKHKLIVKQQVTNQVVDMGCWHRPPNRPKRFSAWSGADRDHGFRWKMITQSGGT
jgi:hypothetical protein